MAGLNKTDNYHIKTQHQTEHHYSASPGTFLNGNQYQRGDVTPLRQHSRGLPKPDGDEAQWHPYSRPLLPLLFYSAQPITEAQKENTKTFLSVA